MTKCVFRISSQISSETFLILRRIRRALPSPSSCKFLPDLNETWILSTEFRKILKYQISWKSVQCGAELFQTDKQMDRQTGHGWYSLFIIFANAPNNVCFPHFRSNSKMLIVLFKIPHLFLLLSSSSSRLLTTQQFSQFPKQYLSH